MKILAIEDQPVAAALLVVTLERLGHEVELAADGGDAWRRLRTGGFRVVVSDWWMPQLDGLELCRRIRALEGDYVYFILISSTKVTRESRDEALAAGVDDFLEKPVDADELRMRLHVAQRIVGLTRRVRALEGILPICGYCKKIRDEANDWSEVETYYAKRDGTRFSHGICPECYRREIIPQLGSEPPRR